MIKESQIEEAIGRMFDGIEFESEPAGLYDPLRYMIAIGGKRIRPRLCLIAYALFADSLGPEIESPATALEVFHSFTLIHDDIMDRSPLRRGVPTVWKKWSEDTAILSGDVMLIDAYRRVACVPQRCFAKVQALFSRTCAQVCEGQQYDMEFESVREVSMDAYAQMIGLKTAVLLACSAKMGAIVAGATDDQCEALYNYGYELGMAFQVADDYLDAYGNQKVFGKPIGGDILNAKKSWLTVRALEKTADKEGFLEVFYSPADTPEAAEAKIAAVKALYDELGVPQEAKAEIERYNASALKAVSDIGLGAVRLESLHRFADSLVGRAK